MAGVANAAVPSAAPSTAASTRKAWCSRFMVRSSREDRGDTWLFQGQHVGRQVLEFLGRSLDRRHRAFGDLAPWILEEGRQPHRIPLLPFLGQIRADLAALPADLVA